MDEKGFFELSDFINEMTKNIKRMESKMMLQDIIMVYNGCYGDTYGEYVEKIEEANKKIRDFRKLDSHSFSTAMFYTPDHIVLEEFQFNYLRKLRGEYQ